MGKQDVIEELKLLGVVYSEKQSLLELQALLARAKGATKGTSGLKPKKDPMANLSNLRKFSLQTILAYLQVPASKKLTKGELLLALREELPMIEAEKMVVGKYKGMTMKDAIADVNYMTWILNEKDLSCSQLNKLKMLARLSFVGQIPEDFGEEEDPAWTELKTEVKKEPKAETKAEPKKEVKTETLTEEIPFPAVPPKPEWTGNPDDWDSYAKACAEWAMKMQASPVSREMKDADKRARG